MIGRNKLSLHIAFWLFILGILVPIHATNAPKLTKNIRQKNLITKDFIKQGLPLPLKKPSPTKLSSLSKKNPLLAQLDIIQKRDEVIPDASVQSNAIESTEKKLTPVEQIPTNGNGNSLVKSNNENTSDEIEPYNKYEDEIEVPLERSQLTTSVAPEQDTIELNFEDASLNQFIKQMEALFDVNFISEETVGKEIIALKNKISYRTTVALSRKEAWNLLLSFLEIAQFTIVPTPNPTIFELKTIPAARKSPIPAYIGVDYKTLPDSDQQIRYVYFIENSTVNALKPIVAALKSPDSTVIELNENKAFLIIDRAYNIKAIMQIVKELDRVSMPQAMSVLKLRHAEAIQVEELYKSLIQGEDQQSPLRPPFNQRKPPAALYFANAPLVIAEPRTNALILLGQRDSIEKIEEFIVKHVDVSLDQPYSPLFVIQLKYAQASVIAPLMNDIVKYGKSSAAGQFGGLRSDDKFLGDMVFTPEEQTNRILIKANYDDFKKAKEIITKLDEPQFQVAIEVLILALTANQAQELGSQIRKKVPGPDGLFGPNITFQTSGLRAGGSPSSIVQNTTGPGVDRLLGNLLNLVTQAGPGNTIVSLGRDAFGVWGILQVLESFSNLTIVSNPFLVATNQTQAGIKVGQNRRLPSGEIVGTGGPNTTTFDGDSAALTVQFIPKINSDGMIVLDLQIEISDFVNPADGTLASATKTVQRVKTQTIMADKEVIALGGLMRNTVNDNLSKVPILGDIPVIGWLFKNRRKSIVKENLIIIVSTRILEPQTETDVNKFTVEHTRDFRDTLQAMNVASDQRDPVYQLYFAPSSQTGENELDNLIFNRSDKTKLSGYTDPIPLAEPRAQLANNSIRETMEQTATSLLTNTEKDKLLKPTTETTTHTSARSRRRLRQKLTVAERKKVEERVAA